MNQIFHFLEHLIDLIMHFLAIADKLPLLLDEADLPGLSQLSIVDR